MRVAVVLSDIAVPPRSGLQEQSLLLIEGLVQAGLDIDLFAFSKQPDTALAGALPVRLAAPLMAMQAGWTVTGLLTRLFGRGGLERRLGAYDVVYLEGAAAAGLLRRSWAPRAVVNLIDPGSRRRWRFAGAARGVAGKVREWAAAALCYLLEASLNDRRATWVVVSDSDAQYLRRVHGHAVTTAIPVMLPGLPAATAHDADATVVLTVYADLREDHMWRAFVELAERVLQPACAAEPSLRIKVLGRLEVSAALRAMLPPLTMTFVAWPDDHLLELQRSAIVILPDPVGTGLKNRAVQNLALGRAVIGTPVAFEAIPVRNGREAIVAGSAAEMLDAVMTLARDASLRAQIGSSAREFATARYGREQVMAQWLRLLQARGAGQ